MEGIRSKWDDLYNPWITKIIAAIIAFYGTYKLAEIGPLSPTAVIIASSMAALFCMWNPGGTAIIYVVVLFISLMHVNSAMVGLIFIIALVYCTVGYASVSCLIITTTAVILSWPEGIYWGSFVLALYFAYRTKENRVLVFYPIFISLLLTMFGKFGTIGILYPNGFKYTISEANDMDSFLSTISFEVDSQYLMPNFGALFKLTIFIMLAAVIIWVIFRNTWLRGKIKNIDICEAVMFAMSAVVIVLLNLVVEATLGFTTEMQYGTVIISIILVYLLTRPFASDKVAETLISKTSLKNRKAEALTFVAVKPKADWETNHVSETTKNLIRNLKKESTKGIVIETESKGNSSHVVDLVAKHFESNIIKIDHDVFEKIYGETREKSFKKILEDAKQQSPTIICFNDAENFFYKVDEHSGEYVKRYHRIYMEAIEVVKELDNVCICFITNDIATIDPTMKEKGIISEKITYVVPDGLVQETITYEEQVELEKKKKKKTNRASAVAIILFLFVLGGLLYYLFVYENQQYDISDTALVETELVGYVYDDNDEVSYANDQVAKIMTSNEATFYYLEEEYEGCYAVYQTDEENFNEMSAARKGTILKKMCKSAEALFNSSYDSLPTMPLSDENNTNSVFDGHLKMGMCVNELNEQFDELEESFADNELILSCDGMIATKLAYCAGNEEHGMMPTYFGVIDGNVTTINAINDISWIDFLSPVGEFSHLQIAVCAIYDPSTIYYGCDRFEINKLN